MDKDDVSQKIIEIYNKYAKDNNSNKIVSIFNYYLYLYQCISEIITSTTEQKSSEDIYYFPRLENARKKVPVNAYHILSQIDLVDKFYNKKKIKQKYFNNWKNVVDKIKILNYLKNFGLKKKYFEKWIQMRNKDVIIINLKHKRQKQLKELKEKFIKNIKNIDRILNNILNERKKETFNLIKTINKIYYIEKLFKTLQIN